MSVSRFWQDSEIARLSPTEEVKIPSYDELHTQRLIEELIGPSGWEIERIRKAQSKTPDMWLRKADTSILTELKTPELHFNLDKGLFLSSTRL